MIDVSIIIVNYNTWSLTIDCIRSIFDKTHGVSFEVIVVDNASSDASVVNIRNNFPNISLIESNENLGFGRANNLAALSASGKYLFFLNSDTVLLNDAITILKEYMDSHPLVGICGGNLFDGNMQPNHSHLRLFPSILNDVDMAAKRLFSKFLIKNMQFNSSELPIEVAYITGADMMISKDLFERISGFDPDFFLYYEETELSYRVNKLGYKIFNVPSSKIIHYEGKSASYSEYKVRIMQESRLLFFSKCYSRFYCTVANVNYLILNAAAICLCYLFNREEASRLINKTMIFLSLVRR